MKNALFAVVALAAVVSLAGCESIGKGKGKGKGKAPVAAVVVSG